jgi:hypothetical protein
MCADFLFTMTPKLRIRFVVPIPKRSDHVRQMVDPGTSEPAAMSIITPSCGSDIDFTTHSLADSVSEGRHKDSPLQRLHEAGRKRFGPEVQRHKSSLILMLPDKKQ